MDMMESSTKENNIILTRDAIVPNLKHISKCMEFLSGYSHESMFDVNATIQRLQTEHDPSFSLKSIENKKSELKIKKDKISKLKDKVNKIIVILLYLINIQVRVVCVVCVVCDELLVLCDESYDVLSDEVEVSEVSVVSEECSEEALSECLRESGKDTMDILQL